MFMYLFLFWGDENGNNTTYSKKVAWSMQRAVAVLLETTEHAVSLEQTNMMSCRLSSSFWLLLSSFIVIDCTELSSPLAILTFRFSVSASAVKEPGHFEVRKSSIQVTRTQGHSQDFLWGALFFLKKGWPPFSQAANASDCFTVKRKKGEAVRYGNIFIFLFTLLPQQSNRQGGARAVDLPARSFDLARPGVAPPLYRLHTNSSLRIHKNHRRKMPDLTTKLHWIQFYQELP